MFLVFKEQFVKAYSKKLLIITIKAHTKHIP
ncbi:hypothetical protein BJQ96_00047 [Flavobacterium sp. PL0002]|nr:hypothetical protein [Flavobacterium sp. PL002]